MAEANQSTTGRRADGPRLRTQLRTRFGTDGAGRDALAHNISRTGLGLLSARVYPPGTALDITVIDHDDVELAMRAELRWTRLLPDDHVSGMRYEMGIQLLDPPVAYALLYGSHAARAEARAALGELVPVTIVSPAERAWSLNERLHPRAALAFLGENPTLGDLCAVRLELPEILDESWALGRVESLHAPSRADVGAVCLRFLRVLVGDKATVDGLLRHVAGQLEIGMLQTALAPLPQAAPAVDAS